jgi:hypothetical protein
VKRWLLLALAAAVVAAALWLLAGRDGPGGPPLDQIDDASRAKLRDVLREPAEP